MDSFFLKRAFCVDQQVINKSRSRYRLRCVFYVTIRIVDTILSIINNLIN